MNRHWDCTDGEATALEEHSAAEAPKKPGAQTAQKPALELPMAEPAVVVPAGHAEQPDARDEPLLATVP